MRRYDKVVLASGHLIDAPDRAEPRFPAKKEDAVGARLASQLDAWDVGAADLAICGGACGADMLFGELCTARGVELWMMLPLHEPRFLETSVRVAGAHWERRYFTLRAQPRVTIFEPGDGEGEATAAASAFERNNHRMVRNARAVVTDPSKLFVLLVWDERPSSDGPGGTADFAALVKDLGGRLAIVNPMRLPSTPD